MIENKTEKLLFYVFLFVGSVFLIIGTFLCIKTFSNNDNKINTTGIITKILVDKGSNGDNHYKVYVAYNVDNKKYETLLNGYSTGYYEGKEINIYYYKDQPNKISTKQFDFLMLILPRMGFIFTLIGGIPLLIKKSKKTTKKYLLQYGTRIEAKYIETTINSSYSVNGKNPFVVICEWINSIDNKRYIFKSDNIWFNPERIIEEKNISTFSIYLDMNNKKKYVIDTDILSQDIVDLT